MDGTLIGYDYIKSGSEDILNTAYPTSLSLPALGAGTSGAFPRVGPFALAHGVGTECTLC